MPSEVGNRVECTVQKQVKVNCFALGRTPALNNWFGQRTTRWSKRG